MLTPMSLALVAAGLGLATRTALSSGAQMLVWGLVVAGVGLGLAQSFGIATAMDTVPAEAEGSGAALLNAVRQFGSVLGIAALGSVSGDRLHAGSVLAARGSVRPAGPGGLRHGLIRAPGRLPAARGVGRGGGGLGRSCLRARHGLRAGDLRRDQRRRGRHRGAGRGLATRAPVLESWS